MLALYVLHTSGQHPELANGTNRGHIDCSILLWGRLADFAFVAIANNSFKFCGPTNCLRPAVSHAPKESISTIARTTFVVE